MVFKVIFSFIIVCSSAVLSQALADSNVPLQSSTSASSADKYVGSKQCIDCHQEQYQAWQGSHHDMAMRHANSETVQGDFNNVSFESNAKVNRFYQKGAQYWVNIEGPDKQFHDYQIKYTFGFEPLQQYMVEFDDGRLQLIPFAWDTRSKDQGGQRWFNLYPEQTEKHQDFFWTNMGQNWNYMCADCHSTNVDKNFDVETNSYNTTYSEINVGCEACHGPASEHIGWTQSQDKSTSSVGFNRTITKAVTSWVAKPGKSTLMPDTKVESEQTLVCAQCHSRHVQISNQDHVEGKALGDRYLMSLINAQRYYPDGQVYDEDYVYGSFLQSKMNKNGVVCSDCHDPHTAKLKLPEKTVCLQCHQTETYANKTHHNHPEASNGAQCVNCHMPETTYMEIDKRRDHAWHIPRPDFANNIGTPDTCLNCHADKNSEWSEQVTQTWYSKKNSEEEQHFAPIFAAIDQGYTQAATALSHIAQNPANASIVRASALERMTNNVDQNALIAIARGAKNNDEHIRIGAIRGAEKMPDQERWRILAPLLSDSVLSVRSEAARVLVPLWNSLTAAQRKALSPALDEYLTIQEFNADRGFAHTNKANVMMHQGKFKEAEQAYLTSIRIEPYFANAYINLADLYRQQKKEIESIDVLIKGTEAIPDNGSLFFSIGLAFIREKQSDKASMYLQKATEVEPNNAHFYYVYGLSLEQNNSQKAQIAIRKAYEVGGNPQHLYALCEMQIRHNAFQAKQCVNEFSKVGPKDAVMALEGLLQRN